jgi:elongation factor Ts
VHHNQKVGALAAVRTGGDKAKADEVLKTLCMHIVAKAPAAATRESIPAETVERETAIYREEVKGKPENIQDKIITGKLDKFFADNVLPEQPWVMDDSVNVAEALRRELGKDTELVGYARFAVGS